MKILIVGLGSMGKRRIRNLQKLGYSDILGYDTQKIRRDESSNKYKIKTFENIDDALRHDPKAMIISTPPNLHLKYANLAIKNNIDFFTELNHSSTHVKQIINKIKGKKILAVPSSTMRYHPVVKELKKLLTKKTIGKILHIQHYYGQDLKTWHPWEDYKDFFASKKETGAAKELVPFELNWLTYLFSDIFSVSAYVDKISDLDVDIDDIYQIQIIFKNKIVCSMILDVIANPSFRETKIIGDNGVILCDFKTGIIKINNGKKWKIKETVIDKIAKGYESSTPPETIYENEIKYFLNGLKSKKSNSFSLFDELKILQILDSIEISNKKGSRINLKK